MIASVAKQASLSLPWSETPEDTFSHDEAQWLKIFTQILCRLHHLNTLGFQVHTFKVDRSFELL